MKKNIIWVVLSITIILTMIFTSCPAETTPTPTTATSTPTTQTSPTPTPETHWWDEWGDPQYGGSLTFRSDMVDIITEPQDPRSSQFATWFELLWCDDMTLDREIYPFKTTFTPAEYRQGWLAESWEQTDPMTWTVKIKEGIKWQNKAPTYGREFTAEDIQYGYDRILAKGEFEGQDTNPFYVSLIPSIDRVVATDNYTVEYQLKEAGALVSLQVMGPYLPLQFVPREWVELTPEEQQDWHNCTGTGPFICTDFVPGTSVTTSRNPDYWGYDERHPENQLPYLDEIKILAIDDMATALAAIRSGKLDMIADARSYPSLADAEVLAQNFPNITQYQWPAGAGGLFYKWNTEPFTDINVRRALQLSIDIDTIAQTLYRGKVDGKPAGLSSPLIGEEWVVPYDDWPEELQQEYGYDLDKAKTLMADAGYPDGFDTEILAATSDDMELLQTIKSMFSELDVEMEIIAMGMVEQRPIAMAGDYTQILYGGGGGGTSPPDQAIGNFWSQKAERTGYAGGVIDSHYDSLVEQFYAATTMEEAQSIYREAERYALEQHWVLTVCPTTTTQVAQPWVKGWNGEMFWGSWGWTYFYRMWIDESLKD